MDNMMEGCSSLKGEFRQRQNISNFPFNLLKQKNEIKMTLFHIWLAYPRKTWRRHRRPFLDDQKGRPASCRNRSEKVLGLHIQEKKFIPKEKLGYFCEEYAESFQYEVGTWWRGQTSHFSQRGHIVTLQRTSTVNIILYDYGGFWPRNAPLRCARPSFLAQ